LFLNTLGVNLPKEKPYKETMNLKENVDLQSHPAFNGNGNGNGNGLQGVKDKFSKADQIAGQRAAARQAQKDAPSARGWERKKGGWVADFAAPLKAAKRAQALGRNSECNPNPSADVKALYLEGFGDALDSSQSSIATASTATTTTQPEIAIKKGMLSAETVELLKERIKLASGEDINVTTIDEYAPAPIDSEIATSPVTKKSEGQEMTKKEKKASKKDKKSKKSNSKKEQASPPGSEVDTEKPASSPVMALASPSASDAAAIASSGQGQLSPFKQPDHDLLSPIASPVAPPAKKSITGTGTTPIFDRALQQRLDEAGDGDGAEVKVKHSW